jgi:hypothetical protein
MSYTVYNKTDGTILKKVICSPEAIALQYDPETAAHIEGEYDKARYKIVDGQAVLKTKTEQADYQYGLVKDTIPPIDPALTDAELDAYIDQYFYGRVDVQQWKKDHYRILRSRHYPPIADFIDAQVKIQSGDATLLSEGDAEMQAYVSKCLDVKAKYQKPEARESL